MRMRGLLCIVVGLATATIVVSAFEPVTFPSSELSRSEQKAAEGLSEYFVELEDVLKIKLPGNKDPEKDMEVVKGLLGSISSVKVSKKKALKLLAGLDELKHDCSHKSYLVYAKNHIANMEIEKENGVSRGWDILKTRTMLDHYQKIHSQHCSAEWRHNFHMSLSHVDDKSLRQIEAVLRDISTYHFNPSGGAPAYWVPDPDRRRFLAMQLPEMSGSPIPEATKKIVKHIMAMLEGTSDWESLKPGVSGKAAKSIIPRPPKKIFDEFLFKPCANYEKVLGENLNHARLDSMAEEEGDQFLAEHQNFYQALVNSKVCKKVLEEQSKLYDTFANIWVEHIKRYHM